ncbi:MAG: hypothetical protein K2W80_19185, partial [Burkholderiales bacterium]|nr:hypothetical protein [Burkholderiales bacterium]
PAPVPASADAVPPAPAPQPASPAPAAVAVPAQSRAAVQPPMPPDRWLEQILDMRRAGRMQEAAESLAAFRKAWPGHPLPPALSAEP